MFHQLGVAAIAGPTDSFVTIRLIEGARGVVGVFRTDRARWRSLGELVLAPPVIP